MAKDKQSAEEEAPASGGKSGLLFALVIVNMVLTLGLGGFMVFQMLSGGDAEAATPVEAPVGEDTSLPPVAGATYAFEPFVVNLMDSVNIRYVKVEIELELSSKEALEEVESSESQLRDMVISVLSNRTYGELLGVRGKIQLREELLRRMNQTLTEGSVTRIYFTEFVVQ